MRQQARDGMVQEIERAINDNLLPVTAIQPKLPVLIRRYFQQLEKLEQHVREQSVTGCRNFVEVCLL